MSEFEWNDYSWEWNSPDDVKEFVGLVLENHSIYEYAYEDLGGAGDENFFTQWWSPVQYAIKSMAKGFSRDELVTSINYLLAPEDDFVECDPAIFDALLKYVPGFPSEYPEFEAAVKIFFDPQAEYTSDWWDFSWYSFMNADFTWTFWGPETLAQSMNVNGDTLTRIFLHSFNAETPYKSFRARVALASNSSCPREILNFLFLNKDNHDWLINDQEERGVLVFNNKRYSINEGIYELEELRKDAAETNLFRYPTDENWRTGPNASFVLNLLGIEWEADDAHTCLLAAFAKNFSLEPEEYLELAKANHPLVRYLLSVNPSIPSQLKEALKQEKPTFTFLPYGGNARYTDEKTLGA